MKTVQLDSFENFCDVTKGYMINVNNDQLKLFKKYYEILLAWNKKINLISRKEQNILEKHFLDSILFLPEIDEVIARAESPKQSRSNSREIDRDCFVANAPRNDNFCIFDIGSGGGFPAIPLAIMRPEWKFTLCESIKKKANFLGHLIKELKIEDRVKIINDRVEMLRATSLQKKFDFVTTRAVGELDELIKYALPLLKKGGYLIAYKAKDIDEELKKISLPLQIFSKEVNGVERRLVVLSNPGVL